MNVHLKKILLVIYTENKPSVNYAYEWETK
jgi:hypothetical protein